jgi:hypothetical protein
LYAASQVFVTRLNLCPSGHIALIGAKIIKKIRYA